MIKQSRYFAFDNFASTMLTSEQAHLDDGASAVITTTVQNVDPQAETTLAVHGGRMASTTRESSSSSSGTTDTETDEIVYSEDEIAIAAAPIRGPTKIAKQGKGRTYSPAMLRSAPANFEQELPDVRSHLQASWTAQSLGPV